MTRDRNLAWCEQNTCDQNTHTLVSKTLARAKQQQQHAALVFIRQLHSIAITSTTIALQLTSYPIPNPNLIANSYYSHNHIQSPIRSLVIITTNPIS